MKKKYTLVFCLFIPVTQATAFAEETATKPWSDEAGLSYVKTGGNTDVATLAFKNLYKLKFADSNTFIWKLAALRAETDGVLTAERYLTDLRLEHAYSERTYSYANTGWMTDEFAGIDKRINVGTGGGYKFLIGPKHFLRNEAGLAVVNETYIDSTDSDYVDGRLFGEYIYAFTDRNKFTQSIEYLHDFNDSDNYRVNSVTALTAALNDSFSLKMSYVIKYDNVTVPSTLNDKDTIFSTAIVANF